MLVKLFTAAVNGLDVRTVEAEVNISKGAKFSLVGLPDSAVRESYYRIKTALHNSGFVLPTNQITINLAPADIRKEGSGYDLPLSLGILAAQGAVDSNSLKRYMFVGELGLDGTLRPIRGALPIAIHARAAKFDGLIVPEANAREAAAVDTLKVYGARNLCEVAEFLNGKAEMEPTEVNTREEFYAHCMEYDADFADVRGQDNVKRALEVAAAGGHNIILVGSPGCGKSMMAKRLPGILPPLSLSESLETTQIHSVAGILDGKTSLVTARPFRSPHHTISDVALIGGGTNFMPGEISLAHNGVLFLDELPEFSRSALETLRQPHGQHYARQVQRHPAVLFHARGVDESLPLRILQPPHAQMRVLAGTDTTLHEPHFRPAARPHGHSGGGHARAFRRPCQLAARRVERNDTQQGNKGARGTDETLWHHKTHTLQRTDVEQHDTRFCRA